MKEYEHWFERFRQVLSAFRQGIIAEADLKKFQLFLLDTGQFNANFDLEELNYLGYPKSPFAMMHEKFYLREVETWAMQLLRFQYQNQCNDFGHLFPIFVDSSLFWNELNRYYRVIQAVDIDIIDASVSSLICALETENQVSVLIEINHPDQNADVAARQSIAKKELEQRIRELVIKKQKIPDILATIFATLNEDPVNVEEVDLSAVLEQLKQLFPQVTEVQQKQFNDLSAKLNSAIDTPETWSKLISLIFIQCRKYKILPIERNTQSKFKNFFQEEPEAFKQLLTELILKLQPDKPSI
jgi:hypothetical protein